MKVGATGGSGYNVCRRASRSEVKTEIDRSESESGVVDVDTVFPVSEKVFK